MSTVGKTDLKGFVFDAICVVPAAKSATVEGFLETVAFWLTRWCIAKRKRSNPPSGYCVFVLHSGPVSASVPATEIVEHFKDDTTPRLANKVCLTDYALNRVAWFDATCEDLAKSVQAVEHAGLSSCPFVVFDTEAERLWIFLQGTAGLPVGLTLHAGDKSDALPTGWADFERILERIWIEDMRYPNDHPSLWHDPAKCYPCREPEKSVQGLVHLALKHRFIDLAGKPRGVFIDKEAHSNRGRADLRAFTADGTCFFAAEIKVAKSFGFTKATDRKPRKRAPAAEFKWVASGVGQARDYKKQYQGQVGVLLIYDMRVAKPKLTKLRSACKKWDVLCRQYPMYGDATGRASHASSPLVVY